MTSTADFGVWGLGGNQDLQAMDGIHGEIPDPSFGYLRGSLLEQRKIDQALMSGRVERDLNNLVYVGKLWMGESEMSFVCAT